MKKCKFLSVLLALVLALSLVSGALAEDAAPEEVTAVDRDTVWSYYDNEKDPLVGTEYEKWNIRTLWARGIFLDSPDWKQAKGSFGAKNGSSTDLGDGFVANTLLNQYKEDGDGIECYFFVTTFQVEDLSRVKQIMGSLYYDDCAVVYLLEVDACVAAGSADGYGKAGQQRNHQQKRKQTGRQMHFLHTRSPFRVFTGLRRHFISTRFPARDIRPLLPPTGIFWKNDLLY